MNSNPSEENLDSNNNSSSDLFDLHDSTPESKDHKHKSVSDPSANSSTLNDFAEDFSISNAYLSNLNESFRFSLKFSALLIVIGFIFTIIGQSLRNLETFGPLFAILAMIGLIIIILSFLSLVRDVQLSSVTKIKYNIVVDTKGIAVYQKSLDNQTPVNFFPFNAYLDAKIVPVTPFIKKNLFLNISAIKFSRLSRNLTAVLVKFRVDKHLEGKTNKQIFFEVPSGHSLFFIENGEKFLKTIKRKRIKRKT